MASLASRESSQIGTAGGGYHQMSPEKLKDGGRWYFSRKEIEENSPSRHDGIDLKKETYLRKSYCTFLQDLGMRLKVPQVTIATAIIFCHRFYLRQSHAKNDRRTIATACMFLAGKVEDTPRPLKDVILVSYEIIHKKDPAAVQKIKQKDVYEQQKELILVGERVVLATLGFDLDVQQPYKPLVEAIKKLKVAQNALAQVAWNFVNDGLRTSLCLQFKSHQIAAGAIFLAAKFLKVKLPSDGEKVWWQEFEVTPRQLEEVSNQMLELYEQNRVPPNQVSEAEGSVAAAGVTKGASRTSVEEQVPNSVSSQAGTGTKPGTMRPPTAHPLPDQSNKHVVLPRSSENRSNEYGEPRASESLDQNIRTGSERNASEDSKEKNSRANRTREGGDVKDKYVSDNTVEFKGAPSQSPSEKIDANKLKELREKRRKSRADVVQKKDSMDEYDCIVKELEEGVELAAAENEKIKQENKQSRSRPSSRSDLENVEDGELSLLEDANQEFQLSKSNDRKRKGDGSSDKNSEGKRWRDNSLTDF